MVRTCAHDACRINGAVDCVEIDVRSLNQTTSVDVHQDGLNEHNACKILRVVELQIEVLQLYQTRVHAYLEVDFFFRDRVSHHVEVAVVLDVYLLESEPRRL